MVACVTQGYGSNVEMAVIVSGMLRTREAFGHSRKANSLVKEAVLYKQSGLAVV